MSSSEYKVMEGKMNKTLDVLHDEFNSVRAGRANPAILDHINVDYYGVPTPIKTDGKCICTGGKNDGYTALGHKRFKRH
jgi:ribosome recycling factor